MTEVKPVMSFFLNPPTQGVLLGTWGDYQRLLYPTYYRKDGQLKWWAKRQWQKELARRRRESK